MDICRSGYDFYQFGFHVKLASQGQGDGLRNSHATNKGYQRTALKGGWVGEKNPYKTYANITQYTFTQAAEDQLINHVSCGHVKQ